MENKDMSFWEKVKLGKQTKHYKKMKWRDRIFSLIILIVLLILGKSYWDTNDYNQIMQNSLGNGITNNIEERDLQQDNSIEEQAIKNR